MTSYEIFLYTPVSLLLLSQSRLSGQPPDSIRHLQYSEDWANSMLRCILYTVYIIHIISHQNSKFTCPPEGKIFLDALQLHSADVGSFYLG